MAAQHLKKHGGDAEKSLAAVGVGASVRAEPRRRRRPADQVDARRPRLRPGRRPRTHRLLLRRRRHLGRPAVPYPAPARPRRPGRRLRGARRGAAPRGGAQADPRRPRRRTRAAAPGSWLEAEITGGLEHPGIVPVYGLGTDADGRPFYAMRFIKGDTPQGGRRPLPRRRIARGGPRPAVAGAAQAAAAVRRRLQRHRLRAQPRRAPPRHQAGQHHRRQARRDAGGRLGAGQGDGPGRARGGLGRADAGALLGQRHRRDAAGQRAGHAGLHEPRAGRRGPGATGAAVATSTAWARRSTTC